MSLRGKFKQIRERKIPILFGIRDGRVLVISKNDVGVVVVLKSASRSMLAAGGSISVAGRDKMPSTIHVFVRDPIERLCSAYQFFRGRPPVNVHLELNHLTWEQFVDAVLANEMNPHWRPVSDILSKIDRNVIPHRFENLSSEYPLGNLEHKNQSKPIDVDVSYKADEIRALYAGDVALRESA